jgi:hypothetical protein
MKTSYAPAGDYPRKGFLEEKTYAETWTHTAEARDAHNDTPPGCEVSMLVASIISHSLPVDEDCPVTERDVLVCSSIACWLGTNVGGALLHEVQQDKGGHFEHDRAVSAWARANRRTTGSNGGWRVLEHIMRGALPLTLRDYDVAEAFVVWLSTEDGAQFVRTAKAAIVTAKSRAYDSMRIAGRLGEHGHFQERVGEWMKACFTPEICADTVERNHRFLEESLELVQSLGCTKEDALMLVDYVFGRPVGEPTQEAGGVMVTLAALCLAAKLNMDSAGETELGRIWLKIEQIRAKQASRPKSSPLPA